MIVSTKTERIFNFVLHIGSLFGYKWASRHDLLGKYNMYENYKKNTCISFMGGIYMYGNIDDYCKEGASILSKQSFLNKFQFSINKKNKQIIVCLMEEF